MLASPRFIFRFEQTPVRVFAASGTLVVVAFYLIAQMVGAGQLIKLLFGLDYEIAVVIVGALINAMMQAAEVGLEPGGALGLTAGAARAAPGRRRPACSAGSGT